MKPWEREAAIGIMENARLSQRLFEACPGITNLNDLIKRAKVVSCPKILKTW